MRTSSVVLLPHAASSVAVARKRLSSELVDSGVYESIVDDASVIVSELLSNALRHARPLPSGQVRVCWLRRGDILELEVSDGGAMTEPRRGPGTLSSLGGRGLGIVEALADGWGVRHEDGATTVWAVLRAPRSATGNGAAAPACAPTVVPDLADFPDLLDEPGDERREEARNGSAPSRAYPA
ncbi:anti-sigma regulatory factor (Ser/Thr protein kinase) [Actinomadura pelletieri DSM 43383]|uniref:Anti-sigma regulatory factor (Ser/Thr protein kinase) n=1 Tax=Actinomadura pelletieri DSM 43383 TaxID=1120940 RepID=A0A495QYW3_9ACTN|nr:ATP-binding protein [Actinomadura pelletieri]RKS79409.1 anti-sigma regulatory factor (Ser/Thr protein kinase) [Actinomadura pelletieri DSM 43383]